jgi:heme/copper-type cytochrome/quinol oxidase subunit 3
VIDSYSHQRSSLALHFFVLSAAVFGTAFGGGWAMIELARNSPPEEFHFPVAFWFSSVALLTGSIALQRSVFFVQRERLRPFRSHLITGLISGTLFVAFQIFGMWVLLRSPEAGYVFDAGEPSVTLGTNKPYVFVAVFLHAMHFFLALLFLVYVTLNGMTGRYDHEYYWGVSVCTWFWHGLGIVWGIILCVFAFVVF